MAEFVKHGHVFIVGTGLVLFWVPFLSRKGGRLHREAGRLYAAFMCVSGISGGWLALQYLAQPGKALDALFLLYALVVYFSIGWHGMQALAAKEDPRKLKTPFNVALDAFNVVAGTAVAAVGLVFRDPYLLGIGPLGLCVGARPLRRMRAAGGPNWWLREHLGGMISTGIAGYTALIFFELSRYLEPRLPLSGLIAVWLAPLAAGAMAIWYNSVTK
jgi:hypothetical protein